MESPQSQRPPNQPVEAPRPKQNLPLAIVAGLIAAITGAIAWAVVTVLSGYQIGYMAIAVGFMVGFGVRRGNGVDKIFSVVGAVLALFGCVFGNFLSMVGFFAKSKNLDVLSALSSIDYSMVPSAMVSGFDVMDLVFYAIAVYEGWRFSRVHQA